MIAQQIVSVCGLNCQLVAHKSCLFDLNSLDDTVADHYDDADTTLHNECAYIRPR